MSLHFPRLSQKAKKAILAEKKRQTMLRPDGWVYVLALSKPVSKMKVGMTSRHPKVRAMEFCCWLMGRVSGPVAYEMWAAPTSDKWAHERSVHLTLEAYRVPGEREVFRAPVDVAVSAIREVCGVDPQRIVL
jgi:hypothetical protein